MSTTRADSLLTHSLERLLNRYLESHKYKEAVPVASRLADLARKQFGEHSVPYAGELYRLGRVHIAVGQTVGGEACLEQAAQIGRDLPAAQPILLAALDALADLRIATGRIAAGEPIAREAYDRRKGLPGGPPVDVIVRLAEAARMLGEHAAAEPLYREAIERQRALGLTDHDTTQALSGLGQLYTDTKRYADAETAYDQVEAILRVADVDPTDLAGLWNNRGMLYRCMACYPEAEAAYVEGLKLLTPLRHRMPGQYASLLSNLAVLYFTTGRTTDAEPLFYDIVELLRDAGSESSLGFGLAHYHLGLLARQQGNYQLAEHFFEEARDVQQRLLGVRHFQVALTKRELAQTLFMAGRYAAAEAFLGEALAILGSDETDVSQEYLAARVGLGVLHRLRGSYTEAETVLVGVLAILEGSGAPVSDTMVQCLHELGLTYLRVGRYSDAASILRRATDLLDTAGCDPMTRALLVNARGVLAELTGNLTEAEGHYTEALSFIIEAEGTSGPNAGACYHNRGIARGKLGRVDEALDDFGKALTIARHNGGRGTSGVATTLVATAALQVRVARAVVTTDPVKSTEAWFDSALESCRWAVTALENAGERGTPHHVDALRQVATILYDQGKHSEAEATFLQAKSVLDLKTDRRTSRAMQGNNLAGIYAVQGRFDEALQVFADTIAEENRLIGQVFALGSERQRLEYLEGLRGTMAAFVSLVRIAPDSAERRRAAFQLVLQRKGIVFESSLRQREMILSARYPHLQPRFRTWTETREELGALTLAGPGTEDPERHRRRLEELARRQEGIEQELAHEARELNSDEWLPSVDQATVVAVLGSGAALVEIVRLRLVDFAARPAMGESRWGSPRYLAFVVGGNQAGDVAMVDLGEAEQIDRLIADYRAWITGIPEGNRAYPESLSREFRDIVETENASAVDLREAAIEEQRAATGAKLRAAVLDPLVAALGERSQVYLALDGDLTRLPFEALPDARGGYLIDRFRFTYLAVGRDLSRFNRHTSERAGPAAVIGAPDYDLGVKASSGPPARGTEIFRPLPGTEAEALKVAELLGVKPYLRGDALESRIKQLRSPFVLHFATHGYFLSGPPSASLPTNPLLRSGLALAGANCRLRGIEPPPEAEDGVLTGEDALCLDLRGTRLVVLSACNTGLGHLQGSEGVFGLRRAFLLAGADSLVMSLWKVADAQTEELMVDFIGRCLKGRPCGEALRDAQLALRARHPAPRFWAAFICQGNPGLLR